MSRKSTSNLIVLLILAAGAVIWGIVKILRDIISGFSNQKNNPSKPIPLNSQKRNFVEAEIIVVRPLVISCPHCSQKLRLPLGNEKKLIVTCSKCNKEFEYVRNKFWEWWLRSYILGKSFFKNKKFKTFLFIWIFFEIFVGYFWKTPGETSRPFSIIFVTIISLILSYITTSYIFYSEAKEEEKLAQLGAQKRQDEEILLNKRKEEAGLREIQAQKRKEEELKRKNEEDRKNREFIDKYKKYSIEEIILNKGIDHSEKLTVLQKVHNYSWDDASELLDSAEKAEKNARLNAVKRKIVQKANELYGAVQSDDRKPIPDDVKMFVWQRDKGKCVKCSDDKNLEFDHIIPVSKGGANTERNIQLLCERCNRQKSDNII